MNYMNIEGKVSILGGSFKIEVDCDYSEGVLHTQFQEGEREQFEFASLLMTTYASKYREENNVINLLDPAYDWLLTEGMIEQLEDIITEHRLDRDYSED